MNMTISGIIEKDGEKAAYVNFEDGACKAEAIIPDCKVLNSEGFTEEEVHMLEQYLIANLADLKKEAAKISPFRAMMK